MSHVATWSVVLFGFWILLSGHFDALHLGMGIAASLGVALASRPLLALSPAMGPAPGMAAAGPLLLRVAAYAAWLAGQIVISSVQVAWVVLHPRMPISPRVIRFRAPLPHPLAGVTLAQSITLTPGTVTLDVQGDEFVVHALTPSTAATVDADGDGEADMPRRVRRLFGGGVS